MSGTLYLIPTTISDDSINSTIPIDVQQIVNKIDHYIVEDIRTARRYLKKVGLKKEIDELTFYVLNEHTPSIEVESFLKPLLENKDMGILSEAGCPGIADPGADAVKIAHQKNITIVPMVGPSSIVLALMASGMNGQNFAFNGYLPVKSAERINKLKQLEKKSQSEHQTQLFIEAPYRNIQLLTDLLQACRDNTLLCIAANITAPDEFIATKRVIDWKKQLPDINKRPTIFILQA